MIRIASAARLILFPILIAGICLLPLPVIGCLTPELSVPVQSLEVIMKLPQPVYESNISIEQALLMRRSVREYRDEPLSLQNVAQLLWAAQGVTDDRGFRTAPSAGGTYPLETYLVAGNVIGLDPGVYRYLSRSHELEKVAAGDVRTGLSSAALGQSCVADAAVSIVFTAVYERTTDRYGEERGVKYVYMEAGHAAQNIYLQTIPLELGTVVVGAFDDDTVRNILQAPAAEYPLYIIPVGIK